MQILNGIKVLDLSQNIAGPFCTQILADMGADVIKIERPQTGDDTRHWTLHTWEGVSTVFLAMNRNKKSVAVDIGSEAGVALITRLAKEADVFVHAIRPGSLEKKGLGFESLKRINPRLVYCSISAFGHKGPQSSAPGYDALLQAYTGIMSVNGHPEMPPARVGVSILDQSTGIWAALGVISALYRRRETGAGALVTASLLESGVNWMTLPLTHFMADGTVTQRHGDLTPMSAPYETFKTSDGTVLVAASNDNLFGNVCDAVGFPELKTDSRFFTNQLRILPKNRGVLHSLIESKTILLTSQECVDQMRKFRAPCEMIMSVDQVSINSQVEALGLIKRIPTTGGSAKQFVDLPISIDDCRSEFRNYPPNLGANTFEVFLESGCSPEEIKQLELTGVIEVNKD